jgi:xanthine dehydrogenase accessory factor
MTPANSELDVLSQARDWVAGGQAVALVTVVKTWGSSPRPAGSIMAVAKDGRFSGSVSGGCVEDDLIARFRTGELGGTFPTTIDYGVDRVEAMRFGLPCGGRLELLVECLDSEQQLGVLLEAIQAGKLMTRRVCLSTGEVSLHPAGVNDDFEYDTAYCKRVFGPAWHMLLIGAGELARFVAQMALMLNYRVTICDPRAQFAQGWQIAGTEFVRHMPDDAVRHMADQPNSIILTLSHDPKLDDMALMEALQSRAAYIGALGSRRSSQSRRERLLQLGITMEQLERLHAPVGLPLGSKTPAEIAVAILAEVTAMRHNRQVVLEHDAASAA